jgi:FkbM family methyltransferase
LRPDLLAPLKSFAKWLLRHPSLADPIVAHAMSTSVALARIAARGLEIRTVIDVGASDGRWSMAARQLWPEARFHLVEANAVHEAKLRRLCTQRPAFSYTVAAAGPVDGMVAFDGSHSFGGQAEPDDAARYPLVPQRSLASIAEQLQLAPPFLIKLDTHGYEGPILEGAAVLFPATNLFVIEAYNFEIRTGSFRFHELCGFMEQHGFRVIDMAEPIWRRKDQALWQFDLFFVPSSRPEFVYKRFD